MVGKTGSADFSKQPMHGYIKCFMRSILVVAYGEGVCQEGVWKTTVYRGNVENLSHI